MLKEQTIPIAEVYVPMARRKTLDPDKVDTLAEDILENGLKTPIMVRPDGERYVLAEGLHRLEACRALGEETIPAFFVQARRTR